MGFDTTNFLFFAQFCLPPATSLSSSRDSQMSLFPLQATTQTPVSKISSRGGKNGIKNPKKGPEEVDFFSIYFLLLLLLCPLHCPPGIISHKRSREVKKDCRRKNADFLKRRPLSRLFLRETASVCRIFLRPRQTGSEALSRLFKRGGTSFSLHFFFVQLREADACGEKTGFFASILK